jgi:AraC-like DNA-binding protein
MSRATFARQFQDRLRRSAADLLTDIRMTLAANKLKKPMASTAAVAAEVGYQSEAAFQRAFKRRIGVTPAQWRRSVANWELPVSELDMTLGAAGGLRWMISPSNSYVSDAWMWPHVHAASRNSAGPIWSKNHVVLGAG